MRMRVELEPDSGAKALEGAEMELLTGSGGGHRNAVRVVYTPLPFSKLTVPETMIL